MESANWFDAAEFCMKLSEQEKLVPFYARSGETIAPARWHGGIGFPARRNGRLPAGPEAPRSTGSGTKTKT